MYFSEERNTEELLYARLVIGLIKHNRTLGLRSVFLRTGLWEESFESGLTEVYSTLS